MNDIRCFFGVFFVLSLITLIGMTFDFTKSDKRFVIKKVMDIIVVVGSYLALMLIYSVFVNNAENISENRMPYIGYITIIISCFNLYTFASQIPIFKNGINETKDIGYKLMIISIIIGLFFAITEIYFAMYMINNEWFIINEEMVGNPIKTAFEFIYFTFAVTITYSGSGIEIVGIIPKIFQMLHVLFFYIFAGDAILRLLKRE